MMKETEMKRVPKLRFPEFTDDWEQRKVGDFTNVLSASRVHKNEWKEDGVPFFRSSDVVSAFKGNSNEKAFISAELYEELIKLSGKLEKDDILITGGGSIGIPYVVPNNEALYSKDADLIWIKNSLKHDSKYLFTYFTSECFRDYINSISHVGTIAHYTIEQVKNTPIWFPNILEQKAIGIYFSHLDHLITLHQRKLEKLKELRKGVMQKLFSQEVRFKADDGSEFPEWEKKPFGDVVSEFKVKTKVEDEDTLLSCAINGMFLNSELFGHQRGQSNIGYLKIKKGTLILSAQNLHLGNANVNLRFEHGIISPAYKTYDIVGCSAEYMSQWAKWDMTKQFFYNATTVGASECRRNVDWNMLYSQLFAVPCLAEQQKIADCLSSLDEVIEKQKETLAAWEELKKGLLQQMFV